MPMLYLVQHGKAYPKEVDPERRLTGEGIKETEAVARKAVELGVKVREIWHSGKARAKMTAEILARHIGCNKLVERPGLNPLDDPMPTYNELIELEYEVMIVGHLPFLSRLLTMLLRVDTEVVKFRYSYLLGLERDESGKYYIVMYVPP